MKTNRVVGCPNLILFIVGSLLFLTPIACNTYSPGGGGGNAPYISALTPASGAVGSPVTITGNYFGASQGSSTVTFNGTAAAPTSWSGTSIMAAVPANATTGSVVITVGGVASNAVSFTVTSTPGPSITSLNPASGPVGTAVTITGTNFGASQGSSTIKFNSTAGTPTSWSGTSIVVPVPTGATSGYVVVTVSNVASNGVTFTVTSTPGPSIASLNPTSGPVGASVTITGMNFGASQGSSTIKFNGAAATPTSWGNTSIVAPVPAGATTGSVVVTVSSVASNGVTFTVTSTPGPSIASLNPTSGPVGTSVTITGTNFGASQGSGTVTFNGTAATPTSWSGTSIVVPVPAGATTGNVVVTVGGLASNGANFNVTTSSGKFPIKASANNRYFVDATGAPWMMVADAAHHMMPAIPQSAVAAYLTDRVGHGFNAIDFYFMCAGAGTCPASGAAFDGTLPFTSGTAPSSYDLATPNNAYWTEVDSVVSQAAADGLVAFVNPIPWGVAFSSTLQNSATKDFNFGVFLGNRYKNSPNIIWHVGQDFSQSSFPNCSDLNLEAQLMAGIRSADPNHLMMIQFNYATSYSQQGTSCSNSTFNSNLTSSFVYSYLETYDEVLKAYNSTPTLPVVLGESNYETGNNLSFLSSAASAYTTREEMWWTMTSGATGHAFGNEHVNHFDSVYTSNLDTTATSQVHYLTDLFAAHSWWTFAPDQAHAVVTAGYGTYNGSNGNLYSASYATTTWDGSTTSITYTPVSTTTLTVDLSKFNKSMNASWYDPTTGTSAPITGSPFANSGTHTFATPTPAHADGTHDWVLVLQ